MNLLEHYQNQHYFNDKYIPRKIELPFHGDINLFGVRGCGKSAMVLEHIKDEDPHTTLYIDMDDPNLIFMPLTLDALQRHIDNHSIELLVLDHYTQGSFSQLPKLKRVIVVTRIALDTDRLEGIELFPLDYEEFMAFESSASTANAFNHFLKVGTLPIVAKANRTNASLMKQFWQSHFSPNEQKLLLVLAAQHTNHLTVHQIYSFAKEKFKVSKDWLYKTVKAFTDEKLIHFIDDRYLKGGKKMILFDFAFAKYLTTGQPFITQFDTMIALTLFKHRIDFDTLGIHGYITKENELIIPSPFESEESLWAKSQKKFSTYKKYGVKKITIVTVANSYEYDIEKLHFEALPFYEWTVLHDEEEYLISK